MDLPIIRLAGTPRRLGEAFGEGCRGEIRELYALRLEAARCFAQRAGRELSEAQVLDACRRCLPLIGIDDLKCMLSDHDGGPNRCICRHDAEGVSTNATVILSPATGEIHACRGQPHAGQWVTRKAGGA